MGIDSKKVPPLPPPTEESESAMSQTELAPSDVSKPTDEKSSYSLPEDGTPVTIKTRGHKPDKSQTSLLIEYFEGGKTSASPDTSGDRKPSVRVRLTPSKNRKTDHIQITETKSSSGRKASLTRRQERAAPLTPTLLKSEEALSVLSGDAEDARSMNSYTSATEESNVSRNPIEVDIDRSGRHRRRRPASPLIPTADSSKASYQPGNMSDISAIPTDSFLDGSGPSSKFEERRDEKRSKSPSRAREVIGGGAVGLAAAAAADKMRSKSRSELSEKERAVLSKSRERDRSDRSERRHKSKHRKSSGSDHVSETGKSSRRRSSKGNEESLVSGADSSLVSSAISHSHRSVDASSVRSGASKSSINNPRLLETVEDAIRRLILPELTAIKREQSKREARRSSVSSATTASRDDLGSERRQSGYSMKSRENLSKGKDRRDREARLDLVESPAPSVDHDSVDESLHEIEQVPRNNDKLKVAAGGAAVGVMAAAAMRESPPATAREQRRRRRAEAKSRLSDKYSEEQENHSEPAPPMPLMSDLNPSEVTRTSILSAETERPHSASEELAPVQQVPRGTPSIDSGSAGSSSPTPTRTPANLQASLGTQHANISHGDLKTLTHKRTGGLEDEIDDLEYARKAPIHQEEVYDEDEYDDPVYNDYYNTQEVPPPLKYVPYQPERRGLSPIPSVSGYTEGGSEVHNRESRLTHKTSETYSSPDKSLRHGGESPSVLSGESYQDDRSLESPILDHRNTIYTDDSELDRVTSGQAVRAVGANPNLVISPTGVESHVASLIEGSALDESVLTGESGRSGRRYGNRDYAGIEEEVVHEPVGPQKHSLESDRTTEEEAVSQVSDQHGAQRSQQFEEYDLDEYGCKVPRSKYRQSPTASEAAIGGAAVAAAAAALRAAAKGKGRQNSFDEDGTFVGEGVQRNKSFKDRTREGYLPANTPTHSVDRLVDEYERPRVTHSGLPDLSDPMPEIGYFGHDDDSRTNPSRMSDRLSATQEARRDQWEEEPVTPTQESIHGRRVHHDQGNGHVLTLDEAAGAAAVATAAAMAHSRSRQPSQDVDDEWHRTSEDRKRDTIVTNPYEGTSPLANAPALDEDFGQIPQFDPNGYVTNYGTRSPFGPKIDEGYISQGPNRTPDLKGKGIDYAQQPPIPGAADPFYNPQEPKHMSGLSQGLGSPMYDAATGAGIERIESKDIVALMQHLMVRDAQRSARDTEILVTLVRTAAEMRTSFDDIKKMLADTEDVIITEVKDNTEKTVQRHIGGPRPYPGSATRSIQAGGSQAGTDNEKKTRNLWRRALKGLSAKGTNDLTRIEDMLMQLLGEVDVLKAQTAHGGIGRDSGPSLDNIQPEVQYEQDRGYEPEGHAGTSTASYASQSGHLSIPRNPSSYERKVSGHRISTVPEGDEDEHYEDSNVVIHSRSNTDMFGPGQEPQRGGSEPLGTPPQPAIGPRASLSHDDTPRNDKAKKHKSSGSSSWFPKISRWSETTASSVGKAFRKSKDTEASSLRGGPSHSGSDLAAYDNYPVTDPYHGDHLHSGFSETDLRQNRRHDPNQIEPDMQFTLAGVARTPVPPSQSPVQGQQPQNPFPLTYSTPEDPKYKAHRNSVNLQHPQPRPGQTEYFRTTLENSAQEFDTPMSPKSAEWAGSVTSLNRFTGNQPTYSNGSASVEQGQYTWAGSSSPAPGPSSSAVPPRPPKEPLDDNQPRSTTPTRSRISNLAYSSTGSPKPENRNLQNVLGIPSRRPSGPRAMGPRSPAQSGEAEERRRKRDTFGTVTSQESDTF